VPGVSIDRADEGVSDRFDVVVVGAGTAGIPTAIEAARAGVRVLLVEKDERIGGTLHSTGGHVAAAGTRRQAERGIEDSAEAWMADIRRITRGVFREDIIGPVVANATELVDWLDDEGFRFAPETPRIVYGHEPYYTPRTYYGVDAGVSLLDVFRPLLDEQVAAGAITLWTQTPVIGLRQDEDGTVTGVVALRRGADVEVVAPHVVLATGGFAADPGLFEELEGFPLVSAAHPTSTGDGLLLARDAGAGFQGSGTYLPTFGGLPHPTTPGRVHWEERPLLTQERAPWEIYVDRHGARWVAEDEPSIDAKERALVGNVDDLTFWTIADDRAVEESVPMVVNWSPDDVRARANVREGVTKADTLAGIAALTGIDEAGLLATVARYNELVARGEDPDFGRTFLPAPIEKPPFYAMRNHGVTLITFVGVDVDADLRARREDGTVVPGLYAVGEVIGATATTGQSFCSGMMITPGVVLGRLLGRRLGALVPPS
jgi:succinate dehydrogenase/fumarate reductase flavoprotein subunit